MFSGIVTAVGSVVALDESANVARLSIESQLFEKESFSIGDSVAVSGVCLTLVALDGSLAQFDLATETRRCTTLGGLQVEEAVNLEPSLCLGDRLHGHFVQGHVDGIATVRRREDEENTTRFEYTIPQVIESLIVPKGAVTIDGVSLTVGEVGQHTFSVYIVPHTLSATTFETQKVGDRVNIEADVLARYVQHLSGREYGE